MSDATTKITANLPQASLDCAMRITGKGITETLVEGLRELERREKRSALEPVA